MAIDILWGKAHQPHHDLESIIYVLVWICLSYAGPKNTPRQGFTFKKKELDIWAGDPPDSTQVETIAASTKFAAFCHGERFELQVLSDIHPYFASLKPCLHELRSLIQAAYFMEDHISHAAIKAVLQKHADMLPEKELDNEPAVTKRGLKRAWRPDSAVLNRSAPTNDSNTNATTSHTETCCLP